MKKSLQHCHNFWKSKVELSKNIFFKLMFDNFHFSGMPIYLVKSVYNNFVDVFAEGHIGLDIAKHAKEGGTVVPMR